MRRLLPSMICNEKPLLILGMKNRKLMLFQVKSMSNLQKEGLKLW
jgi:hypothetical protein